ncbi:MAG: sigma-54-dependent Fis family transcriptional regulator [Paludibacteraceae bacterium]|jgi:DNA-binding NtrC family response regulator|nr:sigma-54-dependent Fis family transcriptional regulator [Paludibacteraceae bacterium]
MARILVVDDERSIRNTVKEVLEHEKHIVELAENAIQAFEKIKAKQYDLVITDIVMPNISGIVLLEKLKEDGYEMPIMIMSAHGNIGMAVDCIKKGAFDYIEKPLDLNRLLVSTRNALDKNKLVKEAKTLKRKIQNNYQMIGESPSIKKLRHLIDLISKTDTRVLITGENGTGKEVVARQIYQNSPRANKPFVEVNCAAIPSELIESELFGHEKGAFTSAIKQRIGKFEQADGGTIFLDEIGDMSLSAQAKVLRCLQENVVSPVGSDKLIKINVRVIAATNKNLQDEIDKGNFREDLYHRLNVVPLHIEPLSKRLEDIPLLIDHFTQIICDTQGRPIKQFSTEAIEKLQQRRWRGNIRELRNIVERLIILCGDIITVEDVDEYCN